MSTSSFIPCQKLLRFTLYPMTAKLSTNKERTTNEVHNNRKSPPADLLRGTLFPPRTRRTQVPSCIPSQPPHGLLWAHLRTWSSSSWKLRISCRLCLNGTVMSFLSSDPALISCVACTDPPVPTLHFLRSDTSDLVQFRDADGILSPYFFPANSLSSPGSYNTLPGINVAIGKLVVAETPEPSTMGLVIAGAAHTRIASATLAPLYADQNSTLDIEREL